MSEDMNVISFLEAGIKAEGSRQKAIANNVANMATPGYRRSDVRFEELLAKAITKDGSVDASKIEAEFYKPMNTSLNSNGNDVSLNSEVGAMVKNTLRHKAYMTILKKKYQQFSTAIRTSG